MTHQCQACNGEGEVGAPCPSCHGYKCEECEATGVVGKECPVCRGKGRVGTWQRVLDGLCWIRGMYVEAMEGGG